MVWHDSVNNQVGIQVNNGTADTGPHTTGVRDTAGPFLLGAESGLGLLYDGLIDEAGFWKRILTTQDKTNLYNSGAGLPYPFNVATPSLSFTSLSVETTAIYQTYGDVLGSYLY